MYDNKNQSDGAIYTNNYKQNDKQPDWTGKVEISRDMLKELNIEEEDIRSIYEI